IPEGMRKPFEGVLNIIRFNRDYFLSAAIVIGLLFLLCRLFFPALMPFILVIVLCISILVLVSLMVSWYVYDYSGLYNFSWLPDHERDRMVVNINAGFDETSGIISRKFPNAELVVFDFYDPLAHTEKSIQRARKAMPPYPGTKRVSTNLLPLADKSADKIFVFLAAHEIRNHDER